MGFVCDRCQKEFVTKPVLRRHIRDVHEKKRHKCDRCEKDFASLGTLRIHKLTKHEGKKRKYNKKQCPHCSKSFRSGSHYNEHLLTHQSLKPFLCPFCSSYAAKRLGNVKQHIDSLHFKCRWFCLMDGCNENVVTAVNMRNHLKNNHEISSDFVNHMEQRRTAATPSSLTPVRGKLPSMPTNNDPREASTSMRQQSAQQFTVKFEDIDTYPKLRSLMNRLELTASSAASTSQAIDASSEIETDESADGDDGTDEGQETKESESEDSALYLVEEEMNKRRRLTWHNPDATGSSSDDDDDDDDDNDDDKQSNSTSSSSSSSFSFTSKPKEKEEPKEEEGDASSSSSGPPPRRIDVKPRKMVWIPTGERSQVGIDVNRLQREPPESEALQLYNNWLREREQQEQEKEQNEEEE